MHIDEQIILTCLYYLIVCLYVDFLKVVPGNSLQEQSLHVPQKKAEQPDDAIYILRDHTSSFRECFLSDFKSGRLDTYIHAIATQLLILFFLSELAISDQDYSKPELHNGEIYFLNSYALNLDTISQNIFHSTIS